MRPTRRSFALLAPLAIAAAIFTFVGCNVVLKNGQVTGPKPEAGSFPATWFAGLPSCAGHPPLEVHAYNDDLYILRQSICTNFEAPFITLIFGGDKVLMLDTGAGDIPIRDVVQGVIDQWLAAKKKPSIELIVAHLHAHGDHVAGDSQFADQPHVTLVGKRPYDVQDFFGIDDWPTQIVSYDLGGGRVVDVIPIPGHEAAHIAVYDRRTALLFTGDSLYPGRLYVRQFPVFKASIQRLVDFIADKPVTAVVGTHIEMSVNPGEDYPMGAEVHPNERALQLGRGDLIELNEALKAMGDVGKYDKHSDFIVVPIGR